MPLALAIRSGPRAGSGPGGRWFSCVAGCRLAPGLQSATLRAIYTHYSPCARVRRAMRSFVTSVSGPRSSPDPVRVCVLCPVLPVRPLCASLAAPIQRPFAIQGLSGFCTAHHRPASGAKFLLSTVAATAISPRSPIHVVIPPSTTPPPPAVAGRAFSARRKGSSSGPAKLLKPPKLLSPSSLGPRQPVSPRPPPTSTALIGSLGDLLC
jgi:hypothetical protein